MRNYGRICLYLRKGISIMFDKSVYIRRRMALREKMASAGAGGVVVFIGNVDSPAQYRDNCYKFRQDSSWLYYFGLDEPRWAALMDLDEGSDTLYADDVDIDDIIWTGPMPSVAEMAAGAGVGKTAPYATLDADVAAAVKAGRTVHVIPQSRVYNEVKLREMGITGSSRALTEAIIEMRLVKEDIEIAQIDDACALGYEMHSLARSLVKPGVVEQEIVGRMEGHTMTRGWGISFATILTQHGEIFHCHSHEATIVPGKLLVIDAGAENAMHYASDFTRTYPTGGTYTPRQRAVYEIVHECNEFAFNMIRPGIAYRDVHLAVARKMLGRLSDLGLVHGDVDDMVAEGVAGLFMPHGLGHNMGLDVHDMEDLGENLVGYDRDQIRSGQLGLGSLRMARRLKPGNVITDEPGIYFIPALIEQWKAAGKAREFVNYTALEGYYDFGGIRLEDDVLVTADGARRLGPKRLPIDPDEIEEIMKNN